MKRHANAKRRRSIDPSCKSWPTNTDAQSNNSSKFSRIKRRKRSRKSMIVRSPYLRPSENKNSPHKGRDKLA